VTVYPNHRPHHASTYPRDILLCIDREAVWSSQQTKGLLRTHKSVPISTMFLRNLPFWGPCFTARCPSPDLAPRKTGFKSLIVKHTVHLNTFRSFGQRTIESQVIHFPVIKSLSGTLICFALGFSDVFRANVGDIESSSVDSNPAPLSPWAFFRPVNSEGKGWLIDLPWLAVLLGFEECDQAVPWDSVGMP
jgi:hypothetical protein